MILEQDIIDFLNSELDKKAKEKSYTTIDKQKKTKEPKLKIKA